MKTFAISVYCETIEEMEAVFAAVKGVGGKVKVETQGDGTASASPAKPGPGRPKKETTAAAPTPAATTADDPFADDAGGGGDDMFSDDAAAKPAVPTATFEDAVAALTALSKVAGGNAKLMEIVSAFGVQRVPHLKTLPAEQQPAAFAKIVAQAKAATK